MRLKASRAVKMWNTIQSKCKFPRVTFDVLRAVSDLETEASSTGAITVPAGSARPLTVLLETAGTLSIH